MFGMLGPVNTSKGTDVTVVKWCAENLSTRSSWMQPDTTIWLNVTVPAAAAFSELKCKTATKITK
jgi:hypothetical protein